MGLFGSRKKKDVIDFTEGYNRSRAKSNTSSASSQTKEKNSDSGFVPLGFFADSASQKESFSENSFDSGDAQERKRKLAKRLVDMTDRIEDLSNQIYHLQQRLELLERKMRPDNSGMDY